MQNNSNNDLVELNSILFDTLRGLKAETTTIEKAKVIATVGGVIVNNAKQQLAIGKALKNYEMVKPLVPKGLPEGVVVPDSIKNPNLKTLGGPVNNGNGVRPISKEDEALTISKMAYAKSMGYSTIANAVAEIGSWKFEEGFKGYLEESKK